MQCRRYQFDSWVVKIPWRKKGYLYQYSWASLVTQTVKNPPATQETWVRSLGREDPLEEDVATHSSILTWGIRTDRGSWWAIVHGVGAGRSESDMNK